MPRRSDRCSIDVLVTIVWSSSYTNGLRSALRYTTTAASTAARAAMAASARPRECVTIWSSAACKIVIVSARAGLPRRGQMQPLRILHVTPYFTDAWAYGGIPRLATSLARGLARRGHHVTVCTTDARDASSRLE